MKLFLHSLRNFCTLALTLISIEFMHSQNNDTLLFDVTINKSSYNLDTVVIGNYNWALSQALVFFPKNANEVAFGANALRMRKTASDPGYIAMVDDKPYGLGTLSFYACRSNFTNDRTGNAPIIAAEYSTDGGNTWISAGANINLSGVDVLTKYEFPNLNVSGNVRIKISVVGGDNDKRLNIDSLVFTSFGAPASCAAVSGLDTLNTDLTAGTVQIAFTSAAPAFEVKVTNVTTSNTTLINPNPTASPVTISGLMVGNDYSIEVRAICGAGDTSSVSTKTFSFAGADPSCEAPSNLVVTNSGNGTISFSWDAPSTPPAVGYVYAVLPTGTTPTQDNFTLNFSNTSVDNLDKTTEVPPVPFQLNESYDVYVVAVCAISPITRSNELKETIVVNSVGMDEVSKTSVKVYPNPTTDILTVNLENLNGEAAQITLMDLTGKQLFSQKTQNSVIDFSLANVVNGVYLLKIESPSITKTVKLIKK